MRSPFHQQFKKRILVLVVILLIGIIVGSLGYMLFEHIPFLDALYMVIITMSTVGYGEVTRLSDTGKIFTIFLIIFYIGIFTYIISIFSSFLIDGYFRNYLKIRKMNKEIARLSNHVVVVGFGRNGKRCCYELSKNHTPFVVIEKNEKVIDDIREAGYYFIHGDGTQENILSLAGITRARTLITTLPIDADNVFSALIAKKINPDIKIISRASEESTENLLKSAGVEHVVTPEIIGGHYMATLITKPHVIEFFNLLTEEIDQNIQTTELNYEDLKDEYRDKSISEMDIRKKSSVNIIAVKDNYGKYHINPDSNTRIGKGMTLIAMGNNTQIKKLHQLFNKNYSSIG